MYSGYIGLREAALHGKGAWKVLLLNSFSLSANALFNVSVVMKFESFTSSSSSSPAENLHSPFCDDISSGDTDSNIPTPYPTAFTEQNVADQKDEPLKASALASAVSNTERVVIPIRGVSLGVWLVDQKVIQDRTPLSVFNQTGSRLSIYSCIIFYYFVLFLLGALISIELNLDPFQVSLNC